MQTDIIWCKKTAYKVIVKRVKNWQMKMNSALAYWNLTFSAHRSNPIFKDFRQIQILSQPPSAQRQTAPKMRYVAGNDALLYNICIVRYITSYSLLGFG